MLQRTAEEAVSPELVNALIRRAAMAGLEGNHAATKLVLDRVCGRSPQAQPEAEPTNLELPKLRSAANCSAAIDAIIAGMSDGTIDLATAKALLDAVERRRKSIETEEHEERLTEMEKAIETVHLPRNGAGRH